MAAAPLLNPQNLTQYGYQATVMVGWDTVSGRFVPMNADDVSAMTTSVSSLLTTLNTYVDGLEGLAANTNTALTTMQGYVDGLEALITSTNAKMDALTASLVPPNTSLYTTAISALGNPLIRTGSGHVYSFSASGIVEIRDNTTVLWTTVGNTSIDLKSPLVYSTSLKLFSTLGSNISIQSD